ncbi:MAG: ATPase [Clostridia bacterium]|nr:ATPase [Clostridia bacterium]
MAENMGVLDLLEEIEDTVDSAPQVPLTGKIMVDGNDMLEIVREIRLALPDDIQQAKWVNDEKTHILESAKNEYEKIILEARKEAEYLVEEDEIKRKAKQDAENILKEAKKSAKQLKMKTYEYVDQMLYEMQEKVDELHLKYFGEMLNNIDHSLADINTILNNNRNEIHKLAENIDNDEK